MIVLTEGRLFAWTNWSWEPGVVFGLAAAATWYARGTRALWRAAGIGHGVTKRQAACYAAAIAVAAAALLSPLDAVADDLFAAHMVQHLLLLIVAAPLIVLASPLLPALWALPRSARRRAMRWWRRSPRVRHSIRAATGPAAAFVSQSIVLWLWHVPALYQLALRRPVVHALEHGSFLVTSVLLWWCIIQPMGRRRLTYGAAILAVWALLVEGGVLGALLIFSRSPWYPAHAAGVEAWGTTLLADQQLAGLIMSIPGSAVYLVAAAALFLAWMRAEEQRTAVFGEPRHSQFRPISRRG